MTILLLVLSIHLGTAGCVQDPVDFSISKPDESFPEPIRDTFTKQIDVFGVRVLGTENSPDEKLVHAAKVMAEYLDNNEDGEVDDPAVVKSMVKRRATLVMFSNSRDRDRAIERWERSGNHDFFDDFHFQDLQADETIPDYVQRGQAGQKTGRFDASLEEVLHLINTAGHVHVYPDAFFGLKRGTRLSDAVDAARGGYHRRVPKRYPEGAWYTYDDRTCDYECQMVEYLYWAITSYLGGQDFGRRGEEIEHEWRFNTPEKLEQGDRLIYELVTDAQYKLPKTLPDGKYRDR